MCTSSNGNTPAGVAKEFKALTEALERLPQAARPAAGLRAIAQLLEFVAYDMAQSEGARQIARLILLAVELERSAEDLEPR